MIGLVLSDPTRTRFFVEYLVAAITSGAYAVRPGGRDPPSAEGSTPDTELTLVDRPSARRRVVDGLIVAKLFFGRPALSLGQSHRQTRRLHRSLQSNAARARFALL
jgi:hypothetical protein